IEVLVNTEAYDDAVKLCQNVLDEKPDDAESLFSIALIYAQQNQLDRAENYLEKLLNNPEWDDQASFYLGKLEQQKRRPEKALVWFDKVVDGRMAFDADMAGLAIVMNLKRQEEVEQRLLKMLNKYPEQRLRILTTKAEFLNQQGNYQQAFDTLSEALKESPDNRDVLYARALIAERMDKLELLEADLLSILRKNPDDVGALNAIGYTLTDKTARYDEAEKYLKRALELQPNESVVIDSYGWLLYKKGQAEQALIYLQKAYERQAENEIAAHLIEVLWSVGSKKEAKELFDSAYKKSPDDEYLLKVKKQVLQSGQ
ncbi:MAG: tetratricopeptide repeat protein, partial [Methylomonas sp.]